MILLLAACAARDVAEAFTNVELSVVDSSAAVNAAFVAAIDGATRDVRLSIPALEDTALSDALVAAHGRGVVVEVVTDVDRAEDAGVVALVAAGVPLHLGDGAVGYHDFAVNDLVGWTSDMVQMTQSMALIDGARVLSANAAGDQGPGTRVMFDVRSEDLAYDMAAEHNQLFAGVDATALTSYDAMAKSVADGRWRYPTQTDLDLEVWLGPQERLTKRVIDAVYSARRSVRIAADDITDEGLARALQEKARSGLEISVVLGEGFGLTTPYRSDVFLDETSEVTVRRVAKRLPTIVLVDAESDTEVRPRAMVLSHPIHSASRLDVEGDTFGYDLEIVTDQLLDGHLFQLTDYDDPSEELVTLRDLVDAWLAEGT